MADVILKRSFRLFWPRSISIICLLKISLVFVDGASFFLSFLAAQTPSLTYVYNLLLDHYSSILTELTISLFFFFGHQSF